MKTITLPDCDNLLFRVEHDTDTPNPVKDSGVEIEMYQLAGGYESTVNTEYDTFVNLFRQFEDNGLTEEKALYATQRYAKMFMNIEPETMGIFETHGYSQSDWLRLFVYVPEGYGLPIGWVEEYEMWANGDVWVVYAEKEHECDECYNIYHESAFEPLSGIYADCEKDAAEYFAEAYV